MIPQMMRFAAAIALVVALTRASVALAQEHSKEWVVAGYEHSQCYADMYNRFMVSRDDDVRCTGKKDDKDNEALSECEFTAWMSYLFGYSRREDDEWTNKFDELDGDYQALYLSAAGGDVDNFCKSVGEQAEEFGWSIFQYYGYFVPEVEPTMAPTVVPSTSPTSNPTQSPSRYPTRFPSISPTLQPSRTPTLQPSVSPTLSPSPQPSPAPTSQPSREPTRQPTLSPTAVPTMAPTESPTLEPTLFPSLFPTFSPSMMPTATPTAITEVQYCLHVSFSSEIREGTIGTSEELTSVMQAFRILLSSLVFPSNVGNLLLVSQALTEMVHSNATEAVASYLLCYSFDLIPPPQDGIDELIGDVDLVIPGLMPFPPLDNFVEATPISEPGRVVIDNEVVLDDDVEDEGAGGETEINLVLAMSVGGGTLFALAAAFSLISKKLKTTRKSPIRRINSTKNDVSTRSSANIVLPNLSSGSSNVCYCHSALCQVCSRTMFNQTTFLPTSADIDFESICNVDVIVEPTPADIYHAVAASDWALVSGLARQMAMNESPTIVDTETFGISGSADNENLADDMTQQSSLKSLVHARMRSLIRDSAWSDVADMAEGLMFTYKTIPPSQDPQQISSDYVRQISDLVAAVHPEHVEYVPHLIKEFKGRESELINQLLRLKNAADRARGNDIRRKESKTKVKASADSAFRSITQGSANSSSI